MKPKIKRCRHAKRDYLVDFRVVNCVLNENNVHPVCENDCEQCTSFDSKYIEYPITVTAVENQDIDFTPLFNDTGALCRIKPCSDEYQGKTFLGFFIGDLPVKIITSYNKESGVLTNGTLKNPAIFVPELRKIVWGAESFWEVIETEEDLKEITDAEINDVWYVQLLKSMLQKEEETKNENAQ